MTATATRIGDGLGHEVDVNGRHTIRTDEPQRLGGEDRGPAPHELLAATLAACASTMVALYARNRGWELGELAVHVDYEPDSLPRSFAIRIDISAALSAEQRSRLERVARTCPVRRTLESECRFEEELNIGRSESAAA